MEHRGSWQPCAHGDAAQVVLLRRQHLRLARGASALVEHVNVSLSPDHEQVSCRKFNLQVRFRMRRSY